MKPLPTPNPQKVLFLLFPLIGAFVGALIVITSPQNKSENDNVSEETKIIPEYPSEDVITYSIENQAEDIPTEAKFHVNSNEPKAISLPSIKSSGFIQKVGIDQRSEIAVPNNINFAGWYVGSVKPSETGVSIINGVVDGKTLPGIFKNLHKIEVDDVFEIEFGDGSKFNFRVVEVKNVRDSDVLESAKTQVESIKEQLNLITSGLNFDERVLIISKKI